LRKRASMSGVRVSGSEIRCTRATRNGQPSRNSTAWKRSSPCTTRWCEPSGAVT
jgi:hypothetical protein